MIRDLQDDLQFALRLADIADEISLRNFGQAIESERKADGSTLARNAASGGSLIASNGAPHDRLLDHFA
jgi:hypothetical protein